LREHRAALEALVTALLDYETVSGDVVHEKLKRTPHRPRDASNLDAQAAAVALTPSRE
jgi:hypothetical protein